LPNRGKSGGSFFFLKVNEKKRKRKRKRKKKEVNLTELIAVSLAKGGGQSEAAVFEAAAKPLVWEITPVRSVSRVT